MYCPQCGNQIPDDSAFCPVCGTDLRAAAPPPEAQPTEAVPPVQSTAQMPATAPPQEYAQPAYPQEPQGVASVSATAPAAPKKRRAGLIVGIVLLCLLLLCGCLGIGGYSYLRYSQRKAAEQPAVLAQPEAPSATEPSEGRPSNAPEQAVDTLYEAISAGEIERVRDAMTAAAGAGIQPGMFEGWDPDFTYRHVESSIDGDTAEAVVQELGGGGLTGGTVTFRLKVEDGAWKVDGWESTALGDTVGTGAGDTILDEAVAIDTVGRMLDALKGDRVSEVKALVSPAYLKKDPTFARPSSEAFLSFELSGAEPKGDGFEVTSKEQWISGPETVYYTVRLVDGTPMVDDVRWP